MRKLQILVTASTKHCAFTMNDAQLKGAIPFRTFADVMLGGSPNIAVCHKLRYAHEARQFVCDQFDDVLRYWPLHNLTAIERLEPCLLAEEGAS